MRINEEIQKNKYKVYESKKNDCDMYRKEKQAIKVATRNFREDHQQQNHERQKMIRLLALEGKMKK